MATAPFAPDHDSRKTNAPCGASRWHVPVLCGTVYQQLVEWRVIHGVIVKLIASIGVFPAFAYPTFNFVQPLIERVDYSKDTPFASFRNIKGDYLLMPRRLPIRVSMPLLFLFLTLSIFGKLRNHVLDPSCWVSQLFFHLKRGAKTVNHLRRFFC